MAGQEDTVETPWTGAVPAAGVAAIARIPIPGTNNLAIELGPRNYKGKSTSTIFLQDATGKKVLRLDYGYNVKSQTVDYHWNQKGTFADFGIADHTTVGKGGAALYRAAQGFRYLGRVLVVYGVVVDAISIVQSNRRLRRATQVVSAWALAWISAEKAGELGAGVGTAIEPGAGTAIVGIVFAIGGGIGGYYVGSKAGAAVYDWGDATFFPLPKEGG